MSFIDDLEDLTIFTAGEFSDVGSVVSPTALYSQISGIFDENVEVMLDYGGIDSSVGGRNFSFKVETAKCDGLLYGDFIAIKGRNFQIVSIDPYGDGKMSELKLKETAFASPTDDDELVKVTTPGQIVGETVAQYRVVAQIDGLFYLADVYDSTRVNAIGVMQQNVAGGGTGSVKWSGYVKNSSWNFDPSKDLFLGREGKIVQSPDLSAIALVELGTIISPTEILLNIKDPIILNE